MKWLFLFLLLLTGCVSEPTYTVSKVIDGDTIEVTPESGEYPMVVRYIGVNAPLGSECWGKAAEEANRAMVLGKPVVLVSGLRERDREGKLLRYVWLSTGEMANKLILAGGYARVVPAEVDEERRRQFSVVQSIAMERKQGIWRYCIDQSEMRSSLLA